LTQELRALLRDADEIVNLGDVSDATFETLRRHFDERQVVEIVWTAALTIYTNMLARPLRIESDGFCVSVARKVTMKTRDRAKRF
jgi:alkylhydroperoxidase family enzyme